LNSEQLKKSEAMANFKMFILLTTMWTRSWRRKREHVGATDKHKKPEFGTFSHLYRDQLEISVSSA
jgi:hypothetical protein